jgi:ABC-type sugar transport system ATPase subunit
LNDGQIVRLPKGKWRGLPSGPLICGIRAESVACAESGNALKASFQFAEELGASHNLHTLVGSDAVIVNHSSAASLPAGKVNLRFDADKVQFFDVSSGRRMASPALGE